jgi:hypothetical protein
MLVSMPAQERTRAARTRAHTHNRVLVSSNSSFLRFY